MSSDLSDSTSGFSVLGGATAAAEYTGSVSIVTPLEGNPISNPLDTKFHVDPLYGQIPVTGYFGVGVGGAYAGADGGISSTIAYNEKIETYNLHLIHLEVTQLTVDMLHLGHEPNQM